MRYNHNVSLKPSEEKKFIIMHIKNLSLNVKTLVSTDNKQKDFKWCKIANNNPNPILSRHV